MGVTRTVQLAALLWLAAGCYTAPPPESVGPAEPGGDEADRGDDSSTDASSPVPTQHASCRFPLPQPMPEDPWTVADQNGKPFDEPGVIDCQSDAFEDGCESDEQCPVGAGCWRASPNDSTRGACLQYCDGDIGCPYDGYCLQPEPTMPGFCVEPLSCDEGGLPVAYRGFACALCTSLRSKTALCCSGFGDFDCRVGPFDHARLLGETCRQHADCEEGLVCTPRADEPRIGMCVCPGVTGASLPQAVQCGFASSPGMWGSYDRRMGNCVDAENGWIDERIAAIDDFPMPQLAVDAGGVVHVVFGNEAHLQHVTISAGVTTLETIELDGQPLLGTNPFMVMDAASAMHIAYLAVGGESMPPPTTHYATNASGTWRDEVVRIDAAPEGIVLDADGQPVIAVSRGYAEKQFTGSLVSRAVDAWDEVSLGEIVGGTLKLALHPDGAIVVYANGVDGNAARLRVANGALMESTLLPGGAAGDHAINVDLTTSPAGEVWLAFDAADENTANGPAAKDTLLLMRDAPTVSAPSSLWTHVDPRFVPEYAMPAIAVDEVGLRHVARRDPRGLVLENETGEGFASESVSAFAPQRFDLVWSKESGPHVFYVNIPDAFDAEPAPTLRHLRRGVCP